MGTFLLRGMLAGLIAACIAFGFAKVYGEPAVDRAIAYEDQHSAAKDEMPGMAAPEEVSRDVQSTLGLGVGLLATGVALGGLFSIAFAFAYGRIGQMSARATALIVAMLSFVAVYLMPFLKYPANPPSVGFTETINYRTQLYFLMITASVIAMVLAVVITRSLIERWGGWNGALLGAGGYLLVMTIFMWIMPVISEVPEGFPASVLFQFRAASLGIQLILWTAIGLIFGALTQRSANAASEQPNALAA